ncbi:NUDIX hydrolase [Schauerella aestuarii]|uniref:NUDIX hydrolase n=1 Tax=Schauerella aestuarii TaxID=2511204 RepID=UPI00137091AA|nr:NUDIX hydrolase [Achromobacter aestuarii]MYZ43005.1 NUDIX domain-containing protein [Achromobacter aestuarii]
MWNGPAFDGAKIALLCGAHVLTYLRDDKDGIPYRGMWDLAGGGREGDESPIACALRETREEFGLIVDPERVVWERLHAPLEAGGLGSYFFVARIEQEAVDAIKFGEEGQRWSLMPINAFLKEVNAVPHLKSRLAAYMLGMAMQAAR